MIGDLADSIRMMIYRRILALRVAMPGTVTSYDRVTQRAKVKPGFKLLQSLPSELRLLIEPPELPSVPVCQPKGYHANLQPGDHVLLVFCDHDLGAWRGASNPTVDPGDDRMHSIAGAVAVPLITRDSSSLSTLAGTNAVSMGSESGTPQFVALENKVMAELNAIRSYVNAHIHVTSATVGIGPVGTILPPKPAMPPIQPVAASDVKAT